MLKGAEMLDPKMFENLSQTMTQFLQGNSSLPGQEAMQQQIKTVLQSSFAKLDLVTREEFDAQAAVLQRTREKLEQLEAMVAELESKES
ncbi:Membrane fusogenic [Marinobacterium sp. xm-a-121]|jgi:ubiquinone biosynthesis accessory factor UbiK|nr:Membrane fusogenic [Marinobacterium sp. xm-g-48]NRP14857.1 Membrane fusogenic [Marinobacterium sp. xm-a-152]NRP27365.1 Membrane fusogenic [Marinobacterium sp. xm-d-420]NRP36784.1 Membrane fusogenic [Marinobacterium sp. xm-d-579]NRP38583.1 Membrane fusogenic [Marinobacterium sp. xm-a-121]NRP46683.1 Membrane fusogenic [Marinobacterium sp. xm-d-543]NRP52480.1 Membrane fusogenic [Marinobacterium sp. xm-v-242]NRP58110.1 Membrane fusogenic [Marinobacterium sp. xm-d-510]NRP59316.1 Membrane fuso